MEQGLACLRTPSEEKTKALYESHDYFERDGQAPVIPAKAGLLRLSHKVAALVGG
jgi:hypothetical protein